MRLSPRVRARPGSPILHEPELERLGHLIHSFLAHTAVAGDEPGQATTLLIPANGCGILGIGNVAMAMLSLLGLAVMPVMFARHGPSDREIERKNRSE